METISADISTLDECGKIEVEAAFILCFMKQAKVEPNTALNLNKLIETTRHHIERRASTSRQHRTKPYNLISLRNEPGKGVGSKPLSLSTSNKSKKKSSSNDNLQPSPLLPPIPHLQGLIGQCCKPIYKYLTCSDLNANLGRLVLPSIAMVENLPTVGLEKEMLLGKGVAVKVYLVNQEGNKEYEMRLKWWSNKYFVLGPGIYWNAFVNDNRKKMAINDKITTWIFRMLDKERSLCVALSIAPRGDMD